ncbi:hypothetical protein Ancab_021900 [Ancistrocladus abbreviatus]
MVVKLHGLAMSTCCATVMATLYEKGVDFELVFVDVFAAQNKEPAFLEKTPFGQVPVLEDDDLTLFESRAISQYVASRYIDQGYDLLRHNDFKEAALVKVWLEVESQRYNPPIHQIIVQYFVMPAFGGTTNQAIIDTNVDLLGKLLDAYESRLSTSKYLAGEKYSLADLHHIPYTHYLMKTPYAELITSRPHVEAWWEDITSRPASMKIRANMILGDKKV